MPLYAYVCSNCGANHEALQKISAAPLTDCPHCAEPALMRKLTAPNFRLKGSGWYETDFKTDKDAKYNLAESAPVENKNEKSEKSDKKDNSKKTDTAAAKTPASSSKPTGSKTEQTKSASSGATTSDS